MSKAIAEQSNSLSIFWLKKYIISDGYKSGVITWIFGASENKNSIGYAAVIDEDESYISLRYTYTDRNSGNKEDMDYKIELTTTPCNYGGKRYWFICPLSKNGKYCGRRVGVIYLIGKYFGCRHCGEIAYNSQMQSDRYKGFVSIPDIEKAEKEIKRYYYKGKPTKKYRKLIRLNEKFDRGLLRTTAKLDKRFANFINSDKL